MTKEEKLIVSAYTGVLMVDIVDYYKFVEKKLGRTVYEYEFAFKDTVDQIKSAVKEDFLKLCKD